MATDKTGALRKVALFQDVSEGELDELSQRVLTRRYARGQMIFSQDDAGDGLYTVVEGRVGISRQNLAGDELIYAWCEPGEYFGELALFDEEPRSATATAGDDSVVLFLPRKAFREFVEAHPATLLKCLEVVVRQLRRCTDLADEIALLDVRSRLARRLMKFADEDEATGKNGKGRGGLRITQQQLANMLGATRESVNKHLNALVDEGAVRLERGRIHVTDRDRLEEVSSGF